MVISRTIKVIQEFIKLESAAGIILFIFAVLAIIFNNSPWQSYYTALQHLPIDLKIGPIFFTSSLLHCVNDGLMAFFFFLVGLEIKREIIIGELNSIQKFALPGFAALGGMIVPAIIYAAFNLHNSINLTGWAIPVATDIAFALGVIALLGQRIPIALKVFLTALAILDDLGAIIIIAIFYTQHISYIFLTLAVLCLVILLILNFIGILNILIYLVVGIALWVCVLKSGIHATIAGVALAMFIPLKDHKNSQNSPLRKIEHRLHPWIAFLVLPIFAFLNAGLSFEGVNLSTLNNPITLGIALGLFFGKQIGVFLTSWLAVKLKLAKLPAGVDWGWIYGIALICGIGFTMSLFIGDLAFNEATPIDATLIRLGVIIGSCLSGIVGFFVLFLKGSPTHQHRDHITKN